MKKNLILIIIINLFLITQIGAIEIGKWKFVVEENFCYIGSAPLKEEGNYTQRGDTYVLVYRINKGSNKIIQITAGYNYDEKKPVIVKIDKTTYEFFGIEDNAWIEEKDKEVIYAMRKGNTMTIQGYSARGTLTADTYTLKGFTSAFNKLSNDC